MKSGTLGKELQTVSDVWSQISEFISKGKHTKLMEEGPEVLLPVLVSKRYFSRLKTL